jgi:hypothetical protein
MGMPALEKNLAGSLDGSKNGKTWKNPMKVWMILGKTHFGKPPLQSQAFQAFADLILSNNSHPLAISDTVV